MSTRKPKAAPTDDELNKLLEGITDDHAQAKPATKGPSKPANVASSQAEQDLLAELENLGAQQSSSRPHTPQLKSAQAAAAKEPPTKRTASPQSATPRSSDEKPAIGRKSGDSSRSYHTSFTPSATSSELQDAEKKSPVAQPAEPAAASGGGWWGGIFATASAVASASVKTAEAAVKEIQQNEEAKRWADQVRGNVGALRGLGKTHGKLKQQIRAPLNTDCFQAENYAPALFQPLPIFFTPLRPPFPPMNAFRYI